MGRKVSKVTLVILGRKVPLGRKVSKATLGILGILGLQAPPDLKVTLDFKVPQDHKG